MWTYCSTQQHLQVLQQIIDLFCCVQIMEHINFFDDLKPSKLFTNWYCFSKVRQNPKEGNFFVQNLKRVAVVDYADIERRIEEGKFEIQNIV